MLYSFDRSCWSGEDGSDIGAIFEFGLYADSGRIVGFLDDITILHIKLGVVGVMFLCADDKRVVKVGNIQKSLKEYDSALACATCNTLPVF